MFLCIDTFGNFIDPIKFTNSFQTDVTLKYAQYFSHIHQFVKFLCGT